jgi:hypothetical protein
LLQGGAALLAAAVSYAVANDFVYRHYPDRADRLPGEPKIVLEPLDVFVDSGGMWVGLTALAVTAAWVFAVRRRSIIGSDQAVAIALLVLAVLAFAVLHYHVGSVLLVVGVVLWLRSGRRAIEIAFFGIPLLLLIAVQVAVLHHSGAYPGRRIIGALTGEPSVWPIIRFGAFSPAAVLSYMAILSVALVRLSNGQRVPVHFLLFIVSVWLPLFAMGVFTWDPEARYTLVALPGFLLCLVAGVVYVARTMRTRGTTPERTVVGRLAFAFGMLVVLQPGALLSAVRNDYSTHPDHRGAAEFVSSLPIQSGDVIIAEDSINQTYYLGRVDYRLLNVDVARKHSVVKNGVLRGQYTGTPVIGSGAELMAILDKARGRRVYIIGSGEDFADHRERSRGNGIREVLEGQRLEKIFVGRDGRTVVWTVRDPSRPSIAPAKEVGMDIRQ